MKASKIPSLAARYLVFLSVNPCTYVDATLPTSKIQLGAGHGCHAYGRRDVGAGDEATAADQPDFSFAG